MRMLSRTIGRLLFPRMDLVTLGCFQPCCAATSPECPNCTAAVFPPQMLVEIEGLVPAECDCSDLTINGAYVLNRGYTAPGSCDWGLILTPALACLQWLHLHIEFVNDTLGWQVYLHTHRPTVASFYSPYIPAVPACGEWNRYELSSSLAGFLWNPYGYACYTAGGAAKAYLTALN